MSRATVRKVVRGQATEFKYERGVQPAPKLGEWVEDLTAILEREAKLPRRERRSTQRLFEELRGRGYDGAHDSVHRFAKALARGTGPGSRPGLRADELCAGRGVSVRLEPRDDHAAGSAADDQGGAHEAVAQPHAVRARLLPRDPGTGLRRPRQGVPVLRRGLPARHLRQHEDGGGGDLRRQGAAVQSSLSADVLAPPDRAGGVHAGVGMGEGAGREPGRQSARPCCSVPSRG